MTDVERRKFLVRAAAGLGASLGARLTSGDDDGTVKADGSSVNILRATDSVQLGKTGIRASRLVVGTGSNGAEQRTLGVEGLSRLLRQSLDRGVNWWETADLYKTHRHVAAALEGLPRDRVVITTKTASKTGGAVRDDIERFLRELKTDVIDILLLHCMQTPDWPKALEDSIAVLDEAKRKGQVRAVGASLHIHDRRWHKNLGPLRSTVDTDWGDVFLVRVNPFAINMDIPKVEDIPRVENIFHKLHEQGKALYGMKILGGADPHRKASMIADEKIDESLRFALTREYLSGFTIGMSRVDQIDDIIARVEKLAVSDKK